jgi:four helix bundle protein
MQNDRAKFKNEFKRRVYQFALDIVFLIDHLPKGQVSNVISEQLLRSATSIGANVIEAQGAPSKKDYAHFFTHALKSANETKFWLNLLIDSGKADKNDANRLLKETTEISKILAASIITMKGRG